MNVCWEQGWVVGLRGSPRDPGEHDVPWLPTHGCNHLVCSACKLAVRSEVCPKGLNTAEPRRTYDEILAWPAGTTATVRVYVCHCHVVHVAYADSIHHDYSFDEDLIPWKTDWSCAGHPLAELPRTYDGIAVTTENIEALVDQAITGHPPENQRDPLDDDPRFWASRLATRLDGTPHQARVVLAAARHLTSADLATRVRAVHFFANTVRFTDAMHPASLLGEHAPLFVGVPNPDTSLHTTKTLDQLLWRICKRQLATDENLREVAHTAAADPARAGRSLFFALAKFDKAWFAKTAVAIGRAHHGERRKDLLVVLGATGLGTAIQAIEHNDAPLVAVLTEARARLANPDSDFTWSSWEDSAAAVAEIDHHLASIERGTIPRLSLSTIFAPTGPMQEVAISSGWSREFLALADRCDDALSK